MSKDIPMEIINIILSYRGIHPVAKLLCCRVCGDDNWKFATKYCFRRKSIYKDYFDILCGDCIHDLAKE